MVGNRSKGGFIRSHQNQFSMLYRFCDIAIIFGCFWLTCLFLEFPWNSDYWLIGLTSIIAFMLVAESLELYRSWRFSQHVEIWLTLALAWGVTSCVVLILVFYFMNDGTIPPILFFGWWIVTWFALSFWRFCYRHFLYYLRRTGRNTRTAAILGLSEPGLNLAKELSGHSQLGINLLGIYDDRQPDRFDEKERNHCKGSLDDLVELAKTGGLDILYVAIPVHAEKRILDIIQRLGDTMVDVHLVPNLFLSQMLHVRWHTVGNMQTLSVFDTPMWGASSWLKRLEDLVLGSMILTLVSLPMLLIAIGIKLTSKGPVFFRQDRYGIDGHCIKVWKFRTMRVMDNGAEVKQATKGDARITPFGSFLRRTSLDELPQFFNVLQGSMSIVGPRPHAVAHNEEYRSQITGYMLRHKVKPGITGWAQINGWRGETDTLCKMEKRIEFDLAYIREWSLWLDLKIVFLTIFKGFIDKNAY